MRKKMGFLIMIFATITFASCDLPFGFGSISFPWESNSVIVSDSNTNSTSESASVSSKPLFFDIYSIEMLGTYGDSTLIKYGDFDILIDSGNSKDSALINKTLNAHVTDQIVDLVIISHPDSDHVSGIINGDVLSGMKDVKRLIVNTTADNNTTLSNKLKKNYPNIVVEKADVLTRPLNKRYTIDVDDDFKIELFYNSYYTGQSTNGASIPVLISYLNTKLFMAGDMEESACTAFISDYPNLFNDEDFVIFKVLHHGSKGSNKDNFLSYIKPDVCFISTPLKVDSTNSLPNYNTHPYIETVANLGNYTKKVYWSSLIGTIDFMCDGYSTTISSLGRNKIYKYYDSQEKRYHAVNKADEKNITVYESYYYRQAIEKFKVTDFANITK